MGRYVLLYVFAILIFLLHFSFSGQAIYGDGIDYWAYLPTIYFDHDLDFKNQFRHIYSPVNNNKVSPEVASQIMKTNFTSIGKYEGLTAEEWYDEYRAVQADFENFKSNCFEAKNGYLICQP